MPSTPKKTCQQILESGNEYLASLKGNQPKLFAAAKEQFVPEQEHSELSKGHGRLERRVTQVCQQTEKLPEWPGLQSVIRVECTREELLSDMIVVTHQVRYYSNPERVAREWSKPVAGKSPWNLTSSSLAILTPES